jgi:NTE family protein
MTKVAVACQGGGMHAAFEVGVLTEILNDMQTQPQKFDLVGLSGTSAGALCALMVWYGLAQKNGKPGSVLEAGKGLDKFWNDFVASPGAEAVLNFLTYRLFRAEEMEVPGLGINAPLVAGSLNPYGALYQTVAAFLPHLYVRREYFDLDGLLKKACPEFNGIEWQKVKTRLLIGASEVVNGLETVFDSNVNKGTVSENKGMQPNLKWKNAFWRQQLPLTLDAVAASGTLPTFRKAQQTKDGVYWDGLYSQNPPVREFIWGAPPAEIPDELWVVRINPQQQAKPETPEINAAIIDRENELMGNLSLNKELDFFMLVNKWKEDYKNEKFGQQRKHVTVRTIKMTQATAAKLRYSSKFDRSKAFMEQLRKEGEEVAKSWLALWKSNKAGKYPEDAKWP